MTVCGELAALAASVPALATRPVRYPLKATRPRKAAGCGVVVWGLVGATSSVLLRVAGPDSVGWHTASVAESLGQLVVLLVAAGVVARYDNILITAVALVIAVEAVVAAAGDVIRTTTSHNEELWGLPGVDPTLAGADVAAVDAGVTVMAAAVLAATSVPLLKAARRAWRFL